MSLSHDFRVDSEPAAGVLLGHRDDQDIPYEDFMPVRIRG